jgi:hypothetical protein
MRRAKECRICPCRSTAVSIPREARPHARGLKPERGAERAAAERSGAALIWIRADSAVRLETSAVDVSADLRRLDSCS